MEVQAEELFQIIGQKEYVIIKLQAELLKLQTANENIIKKDGG